MKFIGRVKELKALQDTLLENNPELIIIYGNRRIGKTTLIKEFIKDKNSIYFLAEENRLNLKRFKGQVAKKLNDDFLNRTKINSFYDLFEYYCKNITDKTSENDRTIFVIDEFTYLIEQDKSIISHFQRIWDELLQNTNHILILCGSSFSTMVNEVLDKKSPLYGRRTKTIQLKEMPIKYFKKFFPNYDAETLLKTYAILGGTTLYLTLFDNKKGLKENIKKQIINKTSFLYKETEFLLNSSFREPSTYNTIIEAISRGLHSNKEIINETEINKTNITKYLSILEKLDIIEKRKSLFSKKNSKNTRYHLKNNFFKFYYRFIEPNKGLIELEEVKSIIDEIMKEFDKYFSKIFEDICRADLQKRKKLIKISSYWHKEIEIDIVGETSNTRFIGECKWIKETDISVLNKLKEKANNLPKTNKKIVFVIYSKKFNTKFQNYAKKNNILLYEPKDLV